jgi:16S rRNA (adenine1518-N6/adenine1519-N6)-dimethyltransferase
LKQKTFRPKKRLGQNFLHDPAIAARIVEAAGLTPGTAVIELGAGKGILTRPLAERGARLIAIELDRELHAELERCFDSGGRSMSASPLLSSRASNSERAAEVASKRPSIAGAESHTPTPASSKRPSIARGNVEVLSADFTKLSITELLASRGFERCILFGNIPYHLTRDVLFSFLVDEHEMIDAAYLMLQREVGERIVSPPGNRVYGITSVVLQSLYAVRPLFRVGPGAFFPRPKVESIVVEFKHLEKAAVEPGELKGFVALVKNLFQQRRKTIHNTLKQFYTLSESELGDIERTTGVSLEKRPEELGKDAFLDLSRTISKFVAAG